MLVTLSSEKVKNIIKSLNLPKVILHYMSLTSLSQNPCITESNITKTITYNQGFYILALCLHGIYVSWFVQCHLWSQLCEGDWKYGNLWIKAMCIVRFCFTCVPNLIFFSFTSLSHSYTILSWSLIGVQRLRYTSRKFHCSLPFCLASSWDKR